MECLPGIAAFVSWHGAEDGERLVRTMLNALAPRGACIAIEASQAAWIGVLDGEVARDGSHIRGVHGALQAESADAALRALDASSAESLPDDFAAVFAERDRLVACRDALGQRPLVWAATERGIFIASEAHAIARVAFAGIDATSIAAFLRGEPPPASQTFFRGIARLPAGHVLVATRERVEVRRWWRPSPDAKRQSPLRDVMRAAVSRRLDAAAPTVVTTSGGIDSSAIAVLAADLRPDTVLAAATFAEPKANETRWLDAIARRTGLRVESFDGAEPMAPISDPDSPHHVALSAFTTGIARAARSHGARVVLSGLGGDELFFERGVFRDLGQHRMWITLLEEALLAPRYSVQPARAWIRDGIAGAIRGSRSRGIAPLAPAGPAPHRVWPSETQQFTWRWLENLAWGLELDERLAARDGLDKRYPLLDRAVVEHVLATPWNERIPSGRMKVLLRRAMAADLPEEIRERTHVTTFEGVLREALDVHLPWIEERVARGPWKSAPFHDRKTAVRLLRRVQNDRARRMSWDDASALWNAASLEAWLRRRDQGIV